MTGLERTETVKQSGTPATVVGKGPKLRWLAVVSGLLVVVLAAVESGRLAGLNGFGQGLVPSIIRANASQPISTGSATGATVGSTTSALPASNVPHLPNPPGFTLAGWYIYVLLAAALILGFVFLLRGGRNAGVYDFAGALEELEAERSRLRRSWSSKLRNATLIRYYSLMRRVCSKVGIEEVAAETPREYIDRVTRELNMNPNEAGKFAEVFNRARYGLELSDEEVEEASGFMGGFVDMIRRRTEIG
jgi:hypothetical protein